MNAFYGSGITVKPLIVNTPH